MMGADDAFEAEHMDGPRGATRSVPPAIDPATGGYSNRVDSLLALMYHQVGEPPAEARHRENWVPVSLFDEQLGALAELGYRSISPNDWRDHLDFGLPIPERPVIITFDDGYRSVLDAWAICRAHGFGAATFFVAGALRPGSTNEWDPDEVPQEVLDECAVRELSDEGMAIGSHSMSHRRLRSLDSASLREELVQSRERIEEVLGHAVTSIAYPYNSTDARVRAAARAAGYRVGFRGAGRISTRATDPLGLFRLKPLAGMDAARFRRLVRVAVIRRWVGW